RGLIAGLGRETEALELLLAPGELEEEVVGDLLLDLELIHVRLVLTEVAGKDVDRVPIVEVLVVYPRCGEDRRRKDRTGRGRDLLDQVRTAYIIPQLALDA